MIIYIFYKYMHCFFHTEEVNRGKEIAVYLLMLLWFIFVGLSASLSLSNVSALLIIFVLTWLYEGRLRRKLAITLFIYGMNFLCEALTWYILLFFNVKTGTDMFFITGAIIMLTLMYLCELLVECGKEYIQKRYSKLEEDEHTKRQLEGYSNQLAVLKNSEEKVRGLRHDLKHHLNELMLLAEHDKSSQIKEYIKSMDSFMTYSGEYVSSGNTDVDSLLNLLLDTAKQELGDVSCKVSIPGELAIEPFDLNVILGNLLDNAILAAKQTQEKHLYVRISYKLGMLLINIENSYVGRLKKVDGRYISTKKDSVNHGMGIENVKSIVKKYDGDMEIRDENNMFKVKVFLYAATG